MRGTKNCVRKRMLTGILLLLVVCGMLFAVTGWKMLQQKTVQIQKQQELQHSAGRFNTESIVLADTTPEQARYLAEKLQAKLRLTEDGSYAVLYLPEGVQVADVYGNASYRPYLSAMSLDYYVSAEAVSANNRELISARPAFLVTDEKYPQQNYLDYLNLRDTWAYTRGAGVTVAVIDSGIDTDHPDFAGKISSRSYDASNDRVVADYDLSVIEDTDGHGTSVAGVIAAGMNDGVGITGIAPEVELIVIKCETDGSGNFLRSSDLVFGLAYAIACDADVVNMSFGTDINVFEKYTKLAVDSDIICVAAAGNDGSALPNYPAADENVIGVGAMDMETWSLASYSNYGFSLVLAPGTAYTTALDGGYQSATGTSISSPIVTSAVALYLSVNPYTEFDVMCQLLKASSVDLGILGEDRQHGFGALDIYALVREEKGTITYEMLTDELKPMTQIFVQGHTVQYMPEPERENVVLDAWYHDIECTDEVAYYETVFSQDVTLYASWINEDDGTAYIYRELSDGTVEIASYTGRRRYLTIPTMLEGKTVTGIGEYAFENNTRLRSVTLPETLEYIADGAFSGCSNLRGIEIPEKVQRIGAQAFYGCVALSQVSLIRNGDLTSIGDGAFGMCGIYTIHLPENLKELGSGVFYGSTAMTSITVETGNAAYQLRNQALYDAAGTTLLYYPAGLTGTYTLDSNTLKVADYAFAHSRSGNVVLNDGLQILGKGAFENSHVRTAALPDSVAQIGEYCYADSYLGQISFGEGSALMYIPNSAFARCAYLKSVALPGQITHIGDGAFGSSGLNSISFSGESKLQVIGTGAFSRCALREIDFPATLIRIESNAFADCWNLTEVTWEQGSELTRIAQYAFESCTALKKVSLPESLEEVGYRAFFGSGLEELAINVNLTVMGDGAFSGCRNLKNIQVTSGNRAYVSVDGVLFSADRKMLHTFPAGRGGVYTLPETVIRIGDYAFAKADGLTQVVLNAGLEEISGYAFSMCASMSVPTLPASLTTIGENAFEHCTAMSGSLLIPKNVISIGRFAFYNDYALTQIIIEPESKLSHIGYGTFGYCGITDFTVPGSVSTMGQEVFVGCKNLLTVTFEADSCLETVAAWTFSGANELRQITFEEGSSLRLLEARSLEGLRKLERITLENCTQLETIDNYAFQFCVSLSEISLPESLTDIGRYAFNGCRSLSRIDLPESVLRIGRYAFNQTGNLNVYFRAGVLPLYLEENWNYGIAGYYVSTAEVITSGNWQYALTNDGTVSIVAYMGDESSIELTTLDGYEIVAIGGYAFADNTSLKSIVLPDTLQGVYQYAFQNTAALETITIPASVQVVDDGAFQGSGLESIHFAENSTLVRLGRYAFADTVNLKEITIPDGVEYIHDYTFRNSGIRSISFGAESALKEIGRYAFQTSKLESVTIPAGVTRIDYDAFRDCVDLAWVDLSETRDLQIFANAFYGSGLTEITIPAGVAYIGEFSFTACPNLTKITVDAANENYASVDGVLYNKALTKLITCPAGLTGSYTVPNTVTTLGFAAFEGSRLSEVIFPANSALVTLGYRVFYNCDNLTSVTIPAGVRSIDNYAFAECNNLASVIFPADSQLGGIYKSAFYNCTALTGISIPAGVQEIGDYAFHGCTSLMELNIPENSQLKGIYDYAFAYTGLTEFIMPEGLLEIGTSAFQGAKLDTLECNEAVVTIGDYAFADCGLANTTELRFPATVEYLGYGVLRGATTIEDLTIPFLGTYVDDTINGRVDVLYGISQSEAVTLKHIKVLKGRYVSDYAFACCPYVTSIELSPETISIGFGSFYTTQIETIELPDTLCTIIGPGWYNLKEVTLPEGLIELGAGAFQYSQITEIVLPKSLNVIGASAFSGTKLTNIIIPENVLKIDGNPFIECTELTRIDVAENNKSYVSLDGILYTKDHSRILSVPSKLSGSVTLPEGLETIEDETFRRCYYITDVELPSTLRKIGNYAFCECSSLRQIIIPESVQLIGTNCFEACTSLTFVDLGMLKALPDAAFRECHSLKTITIPESLTSIGSYCFASCSDLEALHIVKSVIEIGAGITRNCANLKAISVDPNNTMYSSVDGILYSKDQRVLLAAPAGIDGCVDIPEGVIEIAAEAFAECKELEHVTFPDSLRVLGSGCFSYCEKLSGQIIIPEGVTELHGVFENCINLESIYLPDSLESLGRLSGCENLSEIRIGENIRSIQWGALDGTKLYSDERNWIDGVLYLGNYAIKLEPGIQWINLREGTILIASQFASGCIWSLENVKMPDSVKYINERAFSNCYELDTVVFSDQLQEIGFGAFMNCTSLSSVNMPDGVQMIDQAAFFGCSNMKFFFGGRVENSHTGRVIDRDGVSNMQVLAVPYRDSYSLPYLLDGAVCPPEVIITTTGRMNTDFLSGVPQETIIYCYKNEADWPEGWNHGLTTYYKDEWNLATFYIEGVIVTMDPIRADAVVQTPAELQIAEFLWPGEEFLGWDTNGDGLVDEIPVTLTEDLEAHAVLRTPVTAISLSETELTLEVTDEKTLVVSYTPSYFNTSGEILWTSSDETIATVDETGRITAQAEGQVAITATLAENSAVSTSCTVNVIPQQPGIRLKETEGALNVGESLTLELRYVGLEEVMDTLVFHSSDDTIAAVDKNGKITAIAPGTVEITISCGEYTAVYTLAVLLPAESIAIEAPAEGMNVGENMTLNVLFTPENTTDDRHITWTSLNSAVATVSRTGVVTAAAPGTVTIRAESETGLRAKVEITVYAPIQWITLNTTVGTMRIDRTKQLEVIYEPTNTTDDKSVVWSSDDPGVASVDGQGLVTAHKAGVAVITGTVGTHSATYTVTVVGLKDAPTGIIVTNSDDTPMEESVSLMVDPVANGDLINDYAGILDQIEEEMVFDSNTDVVLNAYDISLMQNGGNVQPDKVVDVEIPVTQDIDTDTLQVFRIEDDGSLTDMTAEYQDDKASFLTEHFSLYVVCARKIECSVHTFGSWTTETEATCTETGIECRKCTICGFKEVRPLETVEHEPGETVVENQMDAGCESSGSYDDVVYCTACGKELHRNGVSIPALGHDMGQWETTKEPTCTEKGNKQRECSRCDHTETEETAALGHNHQAVVTAPTCTEKGYTIHTCSRCGDRYVDTYVDALGHNWDTGVVTVEPTEEAEGEMLYTCTVCHATRTEVIPALDHVHNYEAVVTAPTCTEKGYTTHTCSCGDRYVDNYTDPVDHSYEDGHCKWCGKAESYVKWSSISTSLGGNIAMNFYVELSENLIADPDAYIQFTFAGRTLKVALSEGKPSDKNGVTVYQFSCPITSKNMTDEITAQVYNASGAVGEPKSMSVDTYCNWVIANFKDEKTVNLMKGMLNYGASAQKLFNYRTDDLANATLAETDKVFGAVDASAYKHSVEGTEEGIITKSMTLLLDSETTVRVYFELTGDKTIDQYTFTVDGVEVTPTYKDGKYYIERPNISAHRLDDMHVFTCGGITVTYGGLSYVNQVMTYYTEGATFEMASALYAYSRAAEAYIG